MQLEIGWICEICYRALPLIDLPTDWDLVFQSAICPKCLEYAKENDIPFCDLVCGSRACGPDPRAKR
jgi:hypothetical protein